jgi:hypothetical protein
LNFNISAANVQSIVNTVVIINTIEIKRYSFSNQSVHTLQEVLSGSSNLKSTGNRVTGNRYRSLPITIPFTGAIEFIFAQIFIVEPNIFYYLVVLLLLFL